MAQDLSYEMHIAQAVLDVCKHQALKGRTLDNIILESVVEAAIASAAPVDDGRLSQVIYDENSAFNKLDSEDYDAYYERTEKLMDEMTAFSDNLSGEEVVGGLLRFPAGDGNAIYLVKQDKPLVIEHIAFGDAWEAPDVLLRGLDLDYVKQEMHNRSYVLRQRP